MTKRRFPQRDGENAFAPAAVWIMDACGVIGLTAMVASWWKPDLPFVHYAAAIASAGLLMVLGLRFVPYWLVLAWSRKAVPEIPKTKIPHGLLVRVFASLLIFDAAVIVAVYLLRLTGFGQRDFLDAMSFWRCLDSNSYLEIAQYGYVAEGSRAVQLVFVPGYPLAVRFVHLFVGGDYVYAGLVTAGLCFAGAGATLCALVGLDYDSRHAVRAVKYLCIMPGAFFFAAPMSESLFLLLSLVCVYHVRRKKWLVACVFGGLAAFTRTLGLAMMALVLFELIEDTVRTPPRDMRQKLRCLGRFAACLLIAAGFLCYCLVSFKVTGDPLRFLVHQKEHWGQSLGYFFHTAAYQASYAVSCLQNGELTDFFGLWLPQILASFGALVLLICSVKKLRPSYTAYAIGYYVIAIGCTWLLSAVRYLLVLFPLSVALMILGEKSRLNAAMTGTLLLLSGAYLYMFAYRWQVW